MFIVHLPVQVVHSTFVGFQGDPWISCHIDELRPSDKNAITPEVARGFTISQLFYSRLEYNLKKKTSKNTSNTLEGSLEEAEEKPEEQDRLDIETGSESEASEGINIVEQMIEEAISEDTEETETNVKMVVLADTNYSSQTHAAKKEKQESLVQSYSLTLDMEPTQKLNLIPLTTKAPYAHCVRLNSCIQAAVSRLQDSSNNTQRAAERVHLLTRLIPLNPTFPLGIL